MENYEKAENDYIAGMKYKDIAEKYGTTINTVKSWKKRYCWNRKKGAPKNEKGCTQNKVNMKATPVQQEEEDGTKETLQNEELTHEQQMFCIYYSRTFNAAQSYQKAYGCQYTTAAAHGYELLSNVVVRTEIERLKEIKRQKIVAGSDDIVELQMRIAFADIGDYSSFGREELPVMSMFGPIKGEDGKVLTKEVNVIRLNDSSNVDTQLIQEVKQGKDGVSIKLADKQKAIDWLSKHFLMHPDDKYKAEFDRMKAEIDVKQGGITIVNNIPRTDNGKSD